MDGVCSEGSPVCVQLGVVMWTEGCIGLFGTLLCCFSLWDMASWLCHGVCITRGLAGDSSIVGPGRMLGRKIGGMVCLVMSSHGMSFSVVDNRWLSCCYDLGVLLEEGPCLPRQINRDRLLPMSTERVPLYLSCGRILQLTMAFDPRQGIGRASTPSISHVLQHLTAMP